MLCIRIGCIWRSRRSLIISLVVGLLVLLVVLLVLLVLLVLVLGRLRGLLLRRVSRRRLMLRWQHRTHPPNQPSSTNRYSKPRRLTQRQIRGS
jgi:hypothetical protein